MLTYAGLIRRLLSLLYESLLIAAVICCATLSFLIPFSDIGSGTLHHVFQVYLLAIIAAYFVWFWINDRQTLAMKTWHIKIVDINHKPITPQRALIRFTIALLIASLAIFGYMEMGKPGLLLGIIAFAWALVDRDRQFLHDRLAKTRIIFSP